MLILTRRKGESILIGDDVKIMIADIQGPQVKLGISAPRDVGVHREEIYQRIMNESKAENAEVTKDPAVVIKNRKKIVVQS